MSGILGASSGRAASPATVNSATFGTDGRTLTLVFNVAITVPGLDGDCSVRINGSGGTIAAAYVSGSGTTTLVFRTAAVSAYAGDTVTYSVGPLTTAGGSSFIASDAAAVNLSTVPLPSASDPSTILGAKLERWFPAGPSHWFSDALATNPVVDGGPINAMVDSLGALILVGLFVPPIAHLGANGKWFASTDGSSDAIGASSGATMTVAAFFGLVLLPSAQSVPGIAQGSGSERMAPIWIPTPTGLYPGNADDLLNPFTNYVNGSATNTFPGTGTWAVVGQVKNSGSASNSSGTLYVARNSSAGQAACSISFGDLLWLNAQPSGGEQTALETYLTGQIPT